MRETERERQTDRETERKRDKEKKREAQIVLNQHVYLSWLEEGKEQKN